MFLILADCAPCPLPTPPPFIVVVENKLLYKVAPILSNEIYLDDRRSAQFVSDSWKYRGKGLTRGTYNYLKWAHIRMEGAIITKGKWALLRIKREQLSEVNKNEYFLNVKSAL